jgi:ribonuclease HII
VPSPNYKLEEPHWLADRVVAGVDEAGRGPLAGPVVGAAVILPPFCKIEVPRDSKRLTPQQRERIFETLRECAISIGIGVVGADEIDSINILRASLKAMAIAVGRLTPPPDVVLVDGRMRIPVNFPDKVEQIPIVKGDMLSCSIAAASVVAKVVRDRIMEVYHAIYPNYNFKRHKGYPTKEHKEAIRLYGVSSIHRKTFRGVGE